MSVVLKGECSDAASQWYCNTLFYKAFPKALNIGQSGWTTEDWMTSLKSGHPLITRLTEMAYHNHVVIEVGGGLVMDMLRENEEKETEEGVRHVQAMAPLLQKALPHCEISFFSVLPDSFSEEKSLESIGVHRVTDMDPFAEGVLHASFYNITPFHVSAIQKR